MISDIPFNGPVGAVRVGYVDGKLVFNPTNSQMEKSILDLRLAGTKDAIIMVEAGASEVTEELMLDALQQGHATMQAVIDLQESDARRNRQGEKRIPAPRVERRTQVRHQGQNGRSHHRDDQRKRRQVGTQRIDSTRSRKKWLPRSPARTNRSTLPKHSNIRSNPICAR